MTIKKAGGDPSVIARSASDEAISEVRFDLTGRNWLNKKYPRKEVNR